MAGSLQVIEKNGRAESSEEQEFVTLRIDGQLFAIAVDSVRDVLRGLRVTHIPLAPQQVAGSINLRGRIVTALDMRACLGLPKAAERPADKIMSIVAEHKGECYSLIVDSVGEVLSLTVDQIEGNPANLPERWQALASGVYKLPNELLVLLDVRKLFIV